MKPAYRYEKRTHANIRNMKKLHFAFFPVAVKIIFTLQFPAAAVIHSKVCFLHCEAATAHNGLIYYTPFLDNLVLIHHD